MRGDSIELADKTPSYKDFTDCRLNRFLNRELAAKNRLCRPTKDLYFYHTPPCVTAEQLVQLMLEHGAPAPTNVTVFDAKTGELGAMVHARRWSVTLLRTESRSSAGIAEFDNEEAASDALLLCNHQPMQHESKCWGVRGVAHHGHAVCSAGSKFPFVIKLTFATAVPGRDESPAKGQFATAGMARRGVFRGGRGRGSDSWSRRDEPARRQTGRGGSGDFDFGWAAHCRAMAPLSIGCSSGRSHGSRGRGRARGFGDGGAHGFGRDGNGRSRADWVKGEPGLNNWGTLSIFSRSLTVVCFSNCVFFNLWIKLNMLFPCIYFLSFQNSPIFRLMLNLYTFGDVFFNFYPCQTSSSFIDYALKLAP